MHNPKEGWQYCITLLFSTRGHHFGSCCCSGSRFKRLMKKRDCLNTWRRYGTPRHATARNWCTILRTSFDACHRPVAMQVQQSPMNKMRSCARKTFNDVESHNVCSVLCARAQAFVDQVCRADYSAAGRRARFSK